MRIVTEFPRRVRQIEHAWIPLSDGCRLAARLWLPEDAERSPVPGILEYIPYRKRDRMRERDQPMHHYFAGHGYASVRVDVRGSGDSEGILLDEYHEQELRDGLEVIAWISAQPWCTGAVGMMGKSWGGFNALQVAALGPESLRAVISVCASDDRFADDAHYMGGCLLNENLVWGSVLFTLNALPPDPELAGESWRRQWLERLENNTVFPALWMRHQRRDEYWKRGSVCEDLSRLRSAVYLVGGWADGYTNGVPRLLKRLKGPRKALVGPWSHVYPHNGVPGPAIGFLQEALRWWDYWLKDVDTGVMDEPVYRAWMQDSVAPQGFYDVRPGRWVVEDDWPSTNVRAKTYRLVGDALADGAAAGNASESLTISSPLTVGVSAGAWCAFGCEGEMPRDQRDEDAASLVWDSEPLEAKLEILGAPIAHLTLASDRPVAQIAVRLSEVLPDGAVTRVTYGLLNLTHRESHESPSPLEPGRVYQVSVPLNDVAHAFAPGHRIRLAVSTSYWPIAWPPPERVTLTLYPGPSRFELPVREPRREDDELLPFAEPETGPETPAADLQPVTTTITVRHEDDADETIHVVSSGFHDRAPALTRLEPIDLDIGHGSTRRFSITSDDPLSASGEIHHDVVHRRGDWNIRVESRLRMSSTREAFRVDAELHAYEGDERIFTRTWDASIPRDLA